MSPRLDLDAVRRANPLLAVAGNVVQLRPSGKDWLGRCPFHPDRTPSFTIFADNRRFRCFGCGASGDVLDFVQRLHGVSLPEAVRMLGAGELPRIAMPERWHARRESDRSEQARSVWQRTVPLPGTLAEDYLRSRGISPPFPPDMRFARLPCDNHGPLPCLVAAVRDVAGAVVGVQRIWLAHDGQGKADVPKPKRSLGRVMGGAIRLGDLDGSGALTICEGPEDGLSLLEMLGGPVWVSAGASFLAYLQFPPEVRSVVVAADNDPAGEAAAEAAAHAFAARGLTARIIRPVDRHADWNAELMEDLACRRRR